uniref:Uncharacterized protein n=1 Tax=Rhizophora mucronata TaxID=61149 RepID=A0A2P2PC33_RHIMU
MLGHFFDCIFLIHKLIFFLLC